MSRVAIDARGRHTAKSTETAPEVRYVYQAIRTAEPGGPPAPDRAADAGEAPGLRTRARLTGTSRPVRLPNGLLAEGRPDLGRKPVGARHQHRDLPPLGVR